MTPAPFHYRESERLVQLKSYNILDTESEEDFDNLTSMAAEICQTPIALVSLIDEKRQWFKSNHGLSAKETSRDLAFCAHAILNPEEVFIVPNALEDERFHDNDLTIGSPNVIFYAGVPLVGSEGLPLGTLCVIDHQPKELSEKQIQALVILAKQAMNLLELRRKKIQLEEAVSELEESNLELERFAYVAAHDLKSPLNNINSLSYLLTIKDTIQADEEALLYANLMKNSAEKLKNLIDGLLQYSKSSTILHSEREQINVQQFIEDVKSMLVFQDQFKLNITGNTQELLANRTALEQIFINLISNSIKYSDKPETSISIDFTELDTTYQIEVTDNGPGIPEDKFELIFQAFKTLDKTDKFGEKGNGIGLATVKRLVHYQGGEIKLKSTLGVGTTFSICISK